MFAENGHLAREAKLMDECSTQAYAGMGNARRRDEATLDCLRQFAAGPVWDGNVVSKTNRDSLYKEGLIERLRGWNFLTPKGVEYCCVLGILRA